MMKSKPKKMQHSLSKHKAFYAELRKSNLFDHRHDLILEFTDGRTKDSRELSVIEITELLEIVRARNLQPSTKAKNVGFNRTIRKIYYLARLYGYTIEKDGKQIVDKVRLNGWMKKYSYLKKELNEYTLSELPKLCSQFEKVVTLHLGKV